LKLKELELYSNSLELIKTPIKIILSKNMLIDSDLDSEAIPNISEYLTRPFSPSLSFSQLDKSDFSFGGLLEIDKLISELENSKKIQSESTAKLPSCDSQLPRRKEMQSDIENFAPSRSAPSNYDSKIQELRSQIETIQNLYSKELIEHEKDRKNFEETVKKLKSFKKPDIFEESFIRQQSRLTTLSELARSMELYLRTFNFNRLNE
jgi:hypothetical protein